MSAIGESGAPAQPIRIAIAGNPNSGKTTIFNALTGLRQKVGNYPGVTVERREGRLQSLNGTSVTLVDLPGTYSIAARSVDEQVARDVLLGRVDGNGRPAGVVIVLDASNLERNLFLATQIMDLRLPVLLVCNMVDVAKARGKRIDFDALGRRLGVEVLPTIGNRHEGVADLCAAIGDMRFTRIRRAWRLPDALEREVTTLAGVVEAEGVASPDAAEGTAILLLSGQHEQTLGEHVTELPPKVAQAVEEARRRLADAGLPDPATEVIEARYDWLNALMSDVSSGPTNRAITLTDRIDRIVTHRWIGLLIFAVVMFVMFLSIFSWAEPLMNLIDSGTTAMQSVVADTLPPGPLADLLADGVIAGVGGVLVFFPQICILFLFIALLEDTGYMSRAAFIMDRLMSKVGLHGKSFIPLLSSYACAIPGIMAARTIENRRDRLATILVAPLMSCSARLPVYVLLIGAILSTSPWVKAGVMFAMYALGTTTALGMALLFKKTLLRGPTPTFIMELPPYRLPRFSAIARVMWERSKLFLTRAGTVILSISIVLWALAYYPRAEAGRVIASGQGGESSEVIASASSPEDGGQQLRNSYLGRMGRFIEPAVKPLGYDWRIGVGILASFAAREVFVGTMGVIYSVGEEEDETSEGLRNQLAAATWSDGRRVFTPLVAVGLMVFYVLACQCVATIAVVRRETNSWRWPAFLVGYMSTLAYVAALLVYQVGSAFGWGAG